MIHEYQALSLVERVASGETADSALDAVLDEKMDPRRKRKIRKWVKRGAAIGAATLAAYHLGKRHKYPSLHAIHRG